MLVHYTYDFLVLIPISQVIVTYLSGYCSSLDRMRAGCGIRCIKLKQLDPNFSYYNFRSVLRYEILYNMIA